METRGRGLPNYLMSLIIFVFPPVSGCIFVFYFLRKIYRYTPWSLVTSVWELPARHLLPGAYFRYLSFVPAVTTRDGLLERQLLSRFLGINSSLLRCEFFVWFSTLIFLLYKTLFTKRLEFLVSRIFLFAF